MRRIILLSAFAAAQFLPHTAFAQHAAGPTVAACTGKSAGEACNVAKGNTPYGGVCAVVASGDLACLPAVCAQCGDGFVTPEAGEQCDPGPARETAACNLNCTTSICGDGIVNQAAGEQCDPGRVGVPNSFCNANCTVSRCGDGIVNPAANEQCDTGGNSATCTERCFYTMCGDGIVNPAAGEECDTFGVETATCTAQCRLKR
jgi:hypothetical protein